MMTPALLLAVLSTTDKILDLYALMLEKASPETAEKLLSTIAENIEWWQENVWRKLGDFLDDPINLPQK